MIVTWASILCHEDYNEWAFPSIVEIISAIKKDVPVILFAKGAWYALERMAFKSGADALGLDWTVSPEYAREVTRDGITLQGNYDPVQLLSPISEIERSEERRVGKERHGRGRR